ncbi:ABC transporter ATP-binding protein [Anaerococcus sp.]|uniref:ABC transporter ATP-binding protein n=1 Tax=Anaerococcus sp. TaxID=1872515 RepID=UPI0028FE9E21|nr:ABC transporter ATP-binding protein [Anaerococcus sp.]MDU3177644.1 ABC transporter ATP-binding protein [Anaerococcus sp.]
MENQTLIKFENFTFKYKSQQEPTLKNINFKARKGEKIVIIGPSGSGKSTMAKAINSQIPNTFVGDIKGKVTILDKDIENSSIFDISLLVGSVLQDTDGQFVGLTVLEDIAFSLENDNVCQEKMIEIVKMWANNLSIVSLLDHKPNEISGGQKQRVSLAGVLVSETPILLLDEPLANLDPASGLATMRLVDELNKKYNYTVIVIEHRLEEALNLKPDRILVVDEGEILKDDSPSAILKSDILAKIGVRKPLYINALEYAAIDLSRIQNLGSFDNITLSKNDKDMLKSWADKINIIDSSYKKEAILKVKDLSFAYDAYNPVLKDVNFTINKGDVLSIVGQNGAGKSTLAKLLCGFLRPSRGQILLNDTDTKNLSIKQIAEKIGYVLQNPNAMISKTNVSEEVGFGLKLRGASKEEIDFKTEKVLKICGLFPFRNWPISALSYGQKRRVSIASILILNPEILILDEPTAGQDYRHYTEIMEFIHKLNKDYNLTILMISHDMHLIQEYTQRSLVFAETGLLADTSPKTLFSDVDLLEKASLAETSLSKLARAIDYDPEEFIEKFISYERGEL